MNSLGEVGDHGKGRRGRTDLGSVVELEPAPTVQGRLMMVHRRRQQSVQGAGRETLVKLAVHLADFRKYSLNSIAGLGGNPKHRRKGDKVGGQSHLFQQPVLTFFIIFNQVPLVDQDQECPAMVLGIADHPGILLRDTFLGINEHHTNITAAQSLKRLEDGKLFQFIRCLSLAADTCGVNEQIVILVPGEQSVNRITSSSGNT